MTTIERIEHAGGAAITTITAGIGPSDLNIPIADATGWPTGATGPFYAVLNDGGTSVEKIKITSRSGTTLTVAAAGDRGEDGTSAQSHANGTAIHHCLTALEVDAVNAHGAATSNVHGVVGNVVGRTDTQTLLNKTLTSPVITSANLDGTTDNSGATISGGTISGADISGGTLSGTTTAGGTINADTATITNARIRPAGTTDTALRVRERVGGGTGRLIELMTDGGTTMGYFTEEGYAWLANGAVQAGDGFGNATMLRVVAAAADDAVIVARGATSQTADLLRVETSGGVPRLMVQAAASVRVDPAASSGIGLLVKGLASQSGALQQWQDSSGNMLAQVAANGAITAPTSSIGTWETWTPTLTASTTNPTLGSGAVQAGRYQRIGNGMVAFSATIIFGTSGVAAGSGLYTISLPVAPVGAGTFAGIQQVTGTIEDTSAGTRLSCSGWIQDGTTGIVRLIYGGGTGAVTDSSTNCSVGSGTPWTWAASDRLDFSGTYMIA